MLRSVKGVMPFSGFVLQGLLCVVYLSAVTLKAEVPLAVARLSTKMLRQKCLDALNNIQDLRAAFYQKTNKGDAKGVLYLKRPLKGESFGHLCLSYDAPSDLEVLSTGRRLYLHRSLSKETTEIPMTSTPLVLLLRQKIALGQFVREKSLIVEEDRVLWTLYDPQEADKGQVTLVFSSNNFVLEGWRVLDMYGDTTQVVLHQPTINQGISMSVFKKPYAAS
ncbi:MAG: outer membrane lipoprotein carrier protein LolA [Holosporaceae bacterium]